MQIFSLSEGAFTVDESKVFVPFDTATEQLNSRPVGSILVEIQPFAMVTSKDILLFDTGLGYNDADGQMQLHNNLRRAGIDPDKVTKVLISHLHKDHAGGVSTKNAAGERFISFPYATRQLNLTTEEAEKFWPVYRSYTAEIKRMRQSQKGGDILELEENVLNIRKKYRVEFKKLLNTDERATRALTAERDFNNMIRKELQQRMEMRREKN